MIKYLLCDVLGWHQSEPGDDRSFAGLIAYARCRRCHQVGVIDFRGHLSLIT